MKTKTNIIVLTDFSERGESAVLHAASLTTVFQSSLTIVTAFSFSAQSQMPVSQLVKDALQTKMEKYITSDKIVWLSEPYNVQRLHNYADKTNTIMYVIGVSRKKEETFFNRKRAIRFIKTCRLPVMTVGKTPPTENAWQEVMMPIDIDRQSKEKALWAGYFHRFGGATVHVLHTIFKDDFLKQKLAENIAFIDKLYQNLEIKYELHQITPSIDDMDAYSLKYASQINATLTVIMMTKYQTLIDLIAGTKEKGIIGNRYELPVLCINERDDLYVLCT